MPNQDDRELESIIRETSKPSRVDGKEAKKSKVAKLTGRTIGSLRRKIDGKRLDRAYSKYNENYRKMRKALKEANQVRYAQEKGENITDSEVVLAYDEVTKYGKKLAKYGVVLLEDDIARVVANQKAKPKPLKVPRFLVGITRKVLRARDKRMTKKKQKELAKDIKTTTKEYIQNSLESALFKDKQNGELKPELNRNVIQNLGVSKSSNNTEDKLASLRKFISKDGETPVFEDEITKREKPTTDVPPIAPTPSVAKEEKIISEKDMLGDLALKKTVTKEEKSVPITEEPKVTEKSVLEDLKKPESLTTDSMLMGLSKKTPTPKEKTEQPKAEELAVELSSDEKETINRRQREVNVILSLQNSLSQLEKQASEVSDTKTRELIAGYIKSINNEFENIIRRATKQVEDKKETPKESLDPIVVAPEAEKVQETIVSVPKVEQQTEPVKEEPIQSATAIGTKVPDGYEIKQFADGEIATVPKQSEPEEKIEYEIKQFADGEIAKVPVKKNPSLNNVEVKKPEAMMRAEQISRPAALRVTPQDIKNMEERNKNAQQKLADLTQQRKELEEQKKMLQDYISVAKTTRDNEMRAQEMLRSNAALASEVAELNSQRAAIDADLGRAR